MCIIAAKPVGVDLDMEALENCAFWNSDGFGYVFPNPKTKKLDVRKFMNYKGFKSSLRQVVKPLGYKTVPMILHFRVATVGEVTLENCHPYYANPNIALAHNGTIHYLSKEAAKIGYSDSRYLAEEMLSWIQPEQLTRKSLLRLLSEKVVPDASKLALMNNKGQIMIIHGSLGEQHNGIWYSNDTYKESPHSKSHLQRHMGFCGMGESNPTSYQGGYTGAGHTPVTAANDGDKSVNIREVPSLENISDCVTLLSKSDRWDWKFGDTLVCPYCLARTPAYINSTKHDGKHATFCPSCEHPITCTCGSRLMEIELEIRECFSCRERMVFEYCIGSAKTIEDLCS